MVTMAGLLVDHHAPAGSTDAVGLLKSAPLHAVVNERRRRGGRRSDFSVTPFGSSARCIVVTRFAGLVAEKMPGADVATLCPKQAKPVGQK